MDKLLGVGIAALVAFSIWKASAPKPVHHGTPILSDYHSLSAGSSESSVSAMLGTPSREEIVGGTRTSWFAASPSHPAMKITMQKNLATGGWMVIKAEKE